GKDCVHDAELFCPGSVHGGALTNQLQGFVRSNESWQSLRTTTSGNEPKVDFTQPNGGAFLSNPVVTGQRKFESTAQCEAMNGSHHGFFSCGNLRKNRAQPGLSGSGWSIELPHISAAAEASPRSCNGNAGDG